MRFIANVRDAKSLQENERKAIEASVKRMQHERVEPEPAGTAEETNEEAPKTEAEGKAKKARKKKAEA